MGDISVGGAIFGREQFSGGFRGESSIEVGGG